MFQQMMAPEARQDVQRYWWMGFVRGALLIILGLVALLFPLLALFALIVIFGVYAIVDGIFGVTHAIGHRKYVSDWGWLLAEGVLSIIIGILAFAWPGETALVLLFFIAAWAIIRGITELGMSGTISRFAGLRPGALIFSGIVSILFGILLFVFPGSGMLALLWLLGIYGLVGGVLTIIHSFQMRNAIVNTTPTPRMERGMNAI